MTHPLCPQLAKHKIPYIVQAPMREYVTFRTGGTADLLVLPETAEQAILTVRLAREEGQILTLIGGGSNLLVSDLGIRGVTVRLAPPFSRISVSGQNITAEAGAKLSALCAAANAAGLSGLEFSGGIPGTVGGGVFMNAGAYGGEIKDVLSWVELLSQDGSLLKRSAAELSLSYRHSALQSSGDILLRAGFTLTPCDPEVCRQMTADFNARRREKQPLQYPSAGSTFRRPAGHFAGALIEQAGLKGFSIGGAQVSEKHAGFVINRGGATSADIAALICHIQRTVLDASGVLLQPEVRFIGEGAPPWQE